MYSDMPFDKASVVELIKKLADLGYSYSQIAAASGLHRMTILFISRGTVTPRPETRAKIIAGYKKIIEREERNYEALKEANETLETIKGA